MSFIKLDGVNATGDLVDADVMPDRGMILMLDARDLTGSLASGTWNNRAKLQAAAATGLSPQQCQAQFQAFEVAPENGKIEKTLRGGLHVISSPTTSAQWGWFVRTFPELVTWVHQSGHNFYVSIWAKITRGEPSSTTASFSQLAAKNDVGANITAYAIRSNAIFHIPDDSTRRVHTPAAWVGLAGVDVYANAGFNMGVGSGANGANDWKIFGLGKKNNVQAQPGAWTTSPSAVVYQISLEDLTVSGRTYSQARALDQAAHTAAFAPGGRFYGDTYTDPSTIP